MEDLVANAVTLISCPSPGKLPLLDDLAKHFATRTRAVAVVPYDPALEVGSSIEYGDAAAGDPAGLAARRRCDDRAIRRIDRVSAVPPRGRRTRLARSDSPREKGALGV